MKRINGLGSKTISTLIFEEGSLLEEIDAAGLQPQISSLELPESVRVVGGFSGCWNLVSVNMPGVETIKDNAFKYCELLANVSMSTSIKSVGMYAFANCNKLSTLTFPATEALYLSYQPFADCPSLSQLYFKSATPAELYNPDCLGISGNVSIIVRNAAVDSYKTKWFYYTSQIKGE